MTELEKAARMALEALDSLLDVAMVPMTCEGLCSADSAERWDDFSSRRDALRKALARTEFVTLGLLAKRNIYDAIRGAYDLGYNDARNARSVPGDSAPGYDGRSVEEDHGGALFNLLSKRLKPATTERKGEPVAYFVTWPGDPVGMRRFYGADEWASSRETVEYFGGNARPLVYGDTSPQVPEDTDPLQGAVNWLCEARMDVSVDLIQHKLHIGYNRAKRLFDAARKGE